jgi:hypothetical protein
MMPHYSSAASSPGYLLVLVLVFGSVLFIILSAGIGFSIGQSQLVNARFQIQQATDIAEAGLNYYRWYLAHNPNDTTHGTGSAGPYVETYADPEGGVIGEFSLTVSSSTYCGDVASIEVTSTGHLYEAPEYQRTVSARYVRPTVAEYAYIINTNVWAGASRTIIGPYHTNGGVRMDGRNMSTVSSGQASWNCTATFGCSVASTTPGVFTTTANANPALFTYPAAPINFTGLSVDLAQMQNRAQNNGGLYFAPSGAYGYRLTFGTSGTNSTVTVRRVTNTTQYWGYNVGPGWVQERHHITNTTLVGTYTIPANCPLIFVEDKAWIDGVVGRKVTLAAADNDSPGVTRGIILNGNITYATSSAGLLAIAQQDVLLGISVPNEMILNGIYVAQNGLYGRNHYCASCTEGGVARGLPSALDPYVFRDSLTLNGTIVSNGRVGEQWTSSGVTTSGFLDRYNSYDRNLVEDPPPLVPKTSDVYVFRDWREQN